MGSYSAFALFGDGTRSVSDDLSRIKARVSRDSDGFGILGGERVVDQIFTGSQNVQPVDDDVADVNVAVHAVFCKGQKFLGVNAVQYFDGVYALLWLVGGRCRSYRHIDIAANKNKADLDDGGDNICGIRAVADRCNKCFAKRF